MAGVCRYVENASWRSQPGISHLGSSVPQMDCTATAGNARRSFHMKLAARSAPWRIQPLEILMLERVGDVLGSRGRFWKCWVALQGDTCITRRQFFRHCEGHCKVLIFALLIYHTLFHWRRAAGESGRGMHELQEVEGSGLKLYESTCEVVASRSTCRRCSRMHCVSCDTTCLQICLGGKLGWQCPSLNCS